MEVKSSGDESSFSVSVPERADWIIRVTANTAESQTFSVAELQATPLINLAASDPIEYSFQVATGASTPRDSEVSSVNLSSPLCCSPGKKLGLHAGLTGELLWQVSWAEKYL